MAIKIVKNHESFNYDMYQPFDDQIVGCQEIIIDFKPNDPSLERFMDEIERQTTIGAVLNLNIKVLHNNQVMGAKVKKQVEKFAQEMTLNELMKLMALTFDNTDRKLKDIATSMLGKPSDRQKT